MPLWDKVKQELDRAGQVAQDALDEGRIRLEAHRARQHADKAAQTLGYAVFRARQTGSMLDDAELARYVARVSDHEAEVTRLETELADIQRRWREGGGMGAPHSASASDFGGPATPPPGAAPAGGISSDGPVGTPPATTTMDIPPESSDSPVPPPPVTPPSTDAGGMGTPAADPWRPGDVPGKEPY